jgi:hypothetical protein
MGAQPQQLLCQLSLDIGQEGSIPAGISSIK